MSGRLFFSAVSEASVEGEDCSGIGEVGEALQRWDTDPCLHTPSSLSRQFERKESEKRALSQSDNMREKIATRYCKLLDHEEMVGANGFEPSTSWSRTRLTKILSALSGVASGPGPDFLPLLLVRRLSVNWVTNGNRPQIYASGNVHHLQLVLHDVWACDSARLPLPLALGSARFQHFPPQEPVCLGLVAWATLF